MLGYVLAGDSRPAARAPWITVTLAGAPHRPQETIVVVLAEFVPRHWWQQLLHNQSALRLKAALLFRPGVIVSNIPYHLA